MFNIVNLSIVFFITCMVVYPVTVFAEPIIILNKNSFHSQDTIKVSGKLSFQENIPLVIQIRSESDIVAIEQFFPSKSGSFSASFETSGPKWTQPGTYTIIVSYNGEKSQKQFSFSPVITSEKQSSTNEPISVPNPILEKPKPKISLTGFPDPTFAPNYYISLYNTDSDFKKLFDASFPESSIRDLIEYSPTHVVGFPDNDMSPQYYIDRYNMEPRFKIWFDSQFPDNTIYDIVRLSEKTRSMVPIWIKQYAHLWSLEQITDAQFAAGITDLIQKKILLISDDIIKTNHSEDNIPSWFRNTAKWYYDDIITEGDFLFGLQYLIEKEIIRI